MQFKSGQIFWGLFFLTLGTFFFLDKYEIINTDFYFIWDLWPVVFVFVGLMVISRDTFVRPIIAAVFGAYTGLMIFGALNNTISGKFVKAEFDDAEYHKVQKFYEPYNDKIEFADFYLKAGIGICEIRHSTRDLIRGISRGTQTEYYFNTEKAGNKAKITLDLEKKNIKLMGREIKTKLDIQLNENPVWDFDLEIGAAKSYFDLTDYKIRKVFLKTGATDTKLKIGELYDEVYIDVEIGAASLDILIPKEFGCRVEGVMVLMDKDLYGFIEKDDDYFVTKNFNETDNRIMINVDGAVASLMIKRY